MVVQPNLLPVQHVAYFYVGKTQIPSPTLVSHQVYSFLKHTQLPNTIMRKYWQHIKQ